MLLLTLAKHSDNYFCWFQTPSPAECEVSRFFGFFLHAEHALSDILRGTEGKMMSFFFIFIHLHFGIPWTDLLFWGRKQGRGSQTRSGLMVMEENRAGTSLSEASYSQQPVFLHIPSGSPVHFPLSVHTTHPERTGVLPPLHGHTWTPSQKPPVLVFLWSNAFKSTAPSRSP